MKKIFEKMRDAFFKLPILLSLLVSVIISILILIYGWIAGSLDTDIAAFIPLTSIIIIPAILTAENIAFLIMKPKTGKQEIAVKKIEILTIALGIALSALYLLSLNITPLDWSEQLYNRQVHIPVETGSLLTVCVITIVAVIGYLITRFVPLIKQPPLMTVLCIASMYLGVAECILWCVQIWTDVSYYILCLLPFNYIIITAKTIRYIVSQKAEITNKQETDKFNRLSKLLCNVSAWPWLALLAAIPLLGIIVAVLALFGQQPDSIIRAWTKTADWNMSQMIPPQNIQRDEHYLCTVAAGGHRKIVKPIRTGKRHGHRVIVNRQLCIANAFEQVLEERTPRFHRLVRNLYDKTGYPLAKHIRSPYIADMIYFVMKPLEWIFLAVIYLVDTKPENRIAVQYPHSPVQWN
jgi:hypothetical protein